MLDLEAIKNFKIDKSDWQKVKFGDVVFEPKESVKDPIAEGIEHVVGLEHIDSEDIHLRRSASIEQSTTFTKRFRKGDVLFGRRRAYLKKAAKAEFEGICSGDITVMRAREELLLPELLPFLVNNDRFFDYAIKHSAGGLSPRVKFKELNHYEFLLPKLNIQTELKHLFFAIESYAEINKCLIEKQRVLLDSIRMELFKRQRWPLKRLNDFFEVQLGKMLSQKSKVGTSPYPYMANQNIQWGRIDLTKIEKMDFNEAEKEKFELIKGDLLVCEGGDVGRSAIWNNELQNCFYQKALHRLRVINKCYLPEIMLQFMIWANNQEIFRGLTSSTTIAHLTAVKLKELKIPAIPINVQNKFNQKFRYVNDNLHNSERCLMKVNSFKKAIINQVF